jgi:hypothetical protein
MEQKNGTGHQPGQVRPVPKTDDPVVQSPLARCHKWLEICHFFNPNSCINMEYNFIYIVSWYDGSPGALFNIKRHGIWIL